MHLCLLRLLEMDHVILCEGMTREDVYLQLQK